MTSRCTETFGNGLVLAGLLLAGLMQTGCLDTEVRGKSRDMVFPTIRGQFDLRREPVSIRPVQGVMGIEFEASGGSDDFRPESPAFRRAEFDLFDAHIAFRGGMELHRRFRVEGLAGIEYTDFDVEIDRVAGATVRDRSRGFGPLLGIQLSYELLPALDVYGRATTGIPFADRLTEQFELGFDFEVTSNLSVIGAYRWWNYEDERLRFGLVPELAVDLDMQGLMIGLEVTF